MAYVKQNHAGFFLLIPVMAACCISDFSDSRTCHRAIYRCYSGEFRASFGIGYYFDDARYIAYEGGIKKNYI